MFEPVESVQKVTENIYDIIDQVNKSYLPKDLKEAICYNLERQSSEIKSLCHRVEELENSTVKVSHLEINDGKINKIILVCDNLARYN